MKSAKQHIYELSLELSREWLHRQTLDVYAAFYLYYEENESAEPFRKVIISAEDRPSGYVLLDAERLSPAWSSEKARQKIQSVLSRAPIINSAYHETQVQS